MFDHLSKPCTAFEGQRRLLSGPLVEVALALRTALESGSLGTVLVFDDVSGCVVDLDLRGSKADIIERLSRPSQKSVGRYVHPTSPSPSGQERSEPRGRGRPLLGVVAREVTLLPRQWEWLSTQPGGASAVLRRLVDEARRDGGSLRKRRAAQEAAYQFMLAIAGDSAGYEEATRALFANDRPKLEQQILEWPADIRAHVIRLAFDQPDGPKEIKHNEKDAL